MTLTPPNFAAPSVAPAGPSSAGGWSRALRTFGLFIYYLAIIIALLWVYGRGDAPVGPFIYQGF